MTPWIVVALAAIAVLAGAVAISRRRRPDTVDTFRRQIDALSPEARRPTINRGQRLDEETDSDGS